MLYAHGPDLCLASSLRHARANCFEALMGSSSSFLYIICGRDKSEYFGGKVKPVQHLQPDLFATHYAIGLFRALLMAELPYVCDTWILTAELKNRCVCHFCVPF